MHPHHIFHRRRQFIILPAELEWLAEQALSNELAADMLSRYNSKHRAWL